MSKEPEEFDLQPAPRILPMLGEINLSQWQCMAELVDNAVDGFLSVLRASEPLFAPEVAINLPTTDAPSARVTVTDNGPGMSAEHLERAVRAGWSGNSPLDSLGMFGMGFNIATARLGTVTTVWTSRAGDVLEHGLRIDFEELRKQGHFLTPRLTQPKVDSSSGGTCVTIENLKPEQRAWLSKPGNRSGLKKDLARAYSAMLRPNGVPLSFRLTLNGRKLSAHNHCVWGNERLVDTTRHGTVFTVQQIDRTLPDRRFCTACWQWLAALDAVCPACGGAENITKRKRHVHGWLGIQRYLSSTHYGIDFVRNGRKIEIANRDLFRWRDSITGNDELEYPIDDPRQRGRFVGEIHLDHSRVTYMKDRFDRTDPAWDEMVRIVRGEGPLQPQKASNLGFPDNNSPLFKLYQVFRRSSPPKARIAGGWRNVLVVKDNVRAEEMAKKFYEGDPGYQTDQKWWELVEEEDDKLLTSSTGGSVATGEATGSGLAGFGAETDNTGEGSAPQVESGAIDLPRTSIPSLTREYRHDPTSLRWDVKAFEVDAQDPDLGCEARPWLLRRETEGTVSFFVNTKHSIFRSATMTTLDALLCEMAYKAADFTREKAGAQTFSDILAELRNHYAGPLHLDPIVLLSEAETVFRNIARAWCRGIERSDARTLFNDLSSADQEAIYNKMATRGVSDPQEIIADGRFLEYASARAVVEFVIAHPDMFFDDRCWDDAYTDLDYAHPSATERARKQLMQHYEALLLDALWLSEQSADDIQVAPRERVLRAMLAVDLLAPTSGGEASEVD